MSDSPRLIDRELSYTTLPGSRESQLVLKLVGPITLGNLFGFQDAFRALEPPSLLIDMTEVPYIDSAGLGLLLNYYVSAEKSGRHLVLVGVSPRVMTLFSLTKVDAVLTIFPTLPAAFASILY